MNVDSFEYNANEENKENKVTQEVHDSNKDTNPDQCIQKILREAQEIKK